VRHGVASRQKNVALRRMIISGNDGLGRGIYFSVIFTWDSAFLYYCLCLAAYFEFNDRRRLTSSFWLGWWRVDKTECKFSRNMIGVPQIGLLYF